MNIQTVNEIAFHDFERLNNILKEEVRLFYGPSRFLEALFVAWYWYCRRN